MGDSKITRKAAAFAFALATTLTATLATDHGKTIIMASHDPKAVGYFPAVHAMRDGAFETAIEKT